MVFGVWNLVLGVWCLGCGVKGSDLHLDGTWGRAEVAREEEANADSIGNEFQLKQFWQ